MSSLTNSNISELKNILLKRNPILFTGAGFSKYAKNKYEDDIADGWRLKDILLTQELSYEEKSPEYQELITSSLSDLCKYYRLHRGESRLRDFLVDQFSGCIPNNFHKTFSKYPWKKIYTTNIDDILESIFEPKYLLVQNLTRPNLMHSTGKIEYIKLHGCVRNPSNGFVFSSEDYIDSMLKSRDYRFNQFGSDIQFGDFIFVGTDYSEVNLDYYLKLYETSYESSAKGKVFFINPKPSLIFKSKIESINGYIIEWTTSEFADFIESEILSQKKTSKPIDHVDGYFYLNGSTGSFGKAQNYRSSLYLGYQPKWQDIYFDWDFIHHKITQNFEDYTNYIKKYDVKTSVVSIVGKTMSGKSVYLKRLAFMLQKDGFETYELNGRRFDYFSFVNLVRHSSHNKFCLVIDNASYYYGAIASLIKSVPTSKQLIVLTSSRPFFHSRKKYILITEDHHDIYIDNSIDEIFAVEVEKKLDQKGLIGTLKSKSKRERISYLKSRNDLSNVLYEITFGKQFIKRHKDNLLNRYDKMHDGKDVLHYLAILQAVDLSYFPLELLGQLYPKSKKEILQEIDDFIKYNDYNGIELRSPILANAILPKIRSIGKINAIKEILVMISPQVTEEISSYWNEMQASLMKEKLLRKRLFLKSSETKRLLFEIQGYYNDNYNYWLQVGIAEQMDNEFEKALNHFKQAEAISSKSYMVKNAIARNFLKQANYQADASTASVYFSEGEKLMLKLINDREEFQVKAFSTHCYIYEKINFLKKFSISPSTQDLKKLFSLLKVITEKAPDDPMSKHIGNKFYTYLQSIGKSNLINVSFNDLSSIKAMFEKYDLDIESLFEDFEIDE